MRVSLLGVDGTGKTTLVRGLQERYAGRSSLVTAYRVPQYHEHPQAPFAGLSRTLEEIGTMADEKRDPLLKTSVLFLAMSLAGDVQEFFERALKPGTLLSERHPVVDSLAYSEFYTPYLKAPVSRDWEPVLAARLGARWNEVTDWMGTLSARAGATWSFWDLPLIIRDVFSLKGAELTSTLGKLYHVDLATALPDRLVLLKLTPEALAKRMAAKFAGSSASRELHETTAALQALQGLLEKHCGTLKALKPALEVTVLDTSNDSIERALARVSAAIGL